MTYQTQMVNYQYSAPNSPMLPPMDPNSPLFFPSPILTAMTPNNLMLTALMTPSNPNFYSSPMLAPVTLNNPNLYVNTPMTPPNVLSPMFVLDPNIIFNPMLLTQNIPFLNSQMLPPMSPNTPNIPLPIYTEQPQYQQYIEQPQYQQYIEQPQSLITKAEQDFESNTPSTYAPSPHSSRSSGRCSSTEESYYTAPSEESYYTAPCEGFRSRSTSVTRQTNVRSRGHNAKQEQIKKVHKLVEKLFEEKFSKKVDVGLLYQITARNKEQLDVFYKAMKNIYNTVNLKQACCKKSAKKAGRSQMKGIYAIVSVETESEIDDLDKIVKKFNLNGFAKAADANDSNQRH